MFHFAQPATFTGASVTPGPGKTAQVASTVASGNEVAVNLTNVSNVQTLSVTLLNVTMARACGISQCPWPSFSATRAQIVW